MSTTDLASDACLKREGETGWQRWRLTDSGLAYSAAANTRAVANRPSSGKMIPNATPMIMSILSRLGLMPYLHIALFASVCSVSP